MEMPSQVRWLRIAADIAATVRTPPAHFSRGVSRQIAAINSQMPWPQRHHGSVPMFLNTYTDSGAAVNLKNNVSIMIPAATRQHTQLMMCCRRVSPSSDAESALRESRIVAADG